MFVSLSSLIQGTAYFLTDNALNLPLLRSLDVNYIFFNPLNEVVNKNVTINWQK